MEIQARQFPAPGEQTSGVAQDLVDKFFSGEMPAQEEILGHLESAPWPEGIVLAVLGVVYLVYGWKSYKTLVVINAAAAGAIIGAYLGGMHGGRNMQVICGLGCAAALVSISWPFMKYAISVMGGLVGAFLGYSLWSSLSGLVSQTALPEHAWVGALIGLIVLGMLAFAATRTTVIVFTAVQGAAMAVAGITIMACKHDSTRAEITGHLQDNPTLLPLAVFVPAVVGAAFQLAAAKKKDKKKVKAVSGTSE